MRTHLKLSKRMMDGPKNDSVWPCLGHTLTDSIGFSPRAAQKPTILHFRHCDQHRPSSVKILREAPEFHITCWEEQTTFEEHHILTNSMADLILQINGPTHPFRPIPLTTSTISRSTFPKRLSVRAFVTLEVRHPMRNITTVKCGHWIHTLVTVGSN